MKSDSKAISLPLFLGAVLFLAVLVVAMFLYTDRKAQRNIETIVSTSLEEKNALRERIAELESRMETSAVLGRLVEKPLEHRGKLEPQTPDSTWTAKKLLGAYFDCETWPERLHLVLNPSEARPLMETHYSAGFSRPATYDLSLVSDTALDIGDTTTYSVSLTKSISSYVVAQTSNGPRIDWIASSNLWKEEEELRIRKNWGLIDATLEILPGHSRDGEYSGAAELPVLVRNLSQATIDSLTLKVTVYDKSGEFISQGERYFSNMEPQGEGANVFSLRPDIKSNQIGSLTFNVDTLTSINSDGKRFNKAGLYFDVKVIEPKK